MGTLLLMLPAPARAQGGAAAAVPATAAAGAVAATVTVPTASVPTGRQRRPVLTQTQERFAEARRDLVETLDKMTGRRWTEVQQDGTALVSDGTMEIRLQLASLPSAPRDAVEKLKPAGRGPFLIRGTRKKETTKHQLRIIANSEEGLSHGIYYYLDQLGARWFFPGDKWNVIPRREDVSIAIDRLVEPAFVNRRMGGTGGFGSVPYDREQRNRDRWMEWQRRNQFGSEFIVGGHSYGQFVQRHRAIFDKHPEYFAEVGGKRAVPESELKYMGAKFDPSNPAVVRLYVEDRLAELRKQRALEPDGPQSNSITAEPSDGAGHCDSEPCKKIGGPSELVFSVANEVARAVGREFPGAVAGLYAYNQHAAVPKLALEPNLHVMVTPYGFNRTGLSAEQLIEAWSRKTRNLGMREYWSITDWSLDMPNLNFVKTPAEKIRLWQRFGVNSLVAESSYSSGAVGPAWIVGSRLLWDPAADEHAILADFYDKAFGPAAAPMKRMLERWANGFRLISSELGLSFQDLSEAMKLAAGRPDVIARLDNYTAYVQYLRLRYELDMERRGTTEEREAAMIAMARHLNNIYDTSMVAVTRINQLMLSRYPDGPVRRKYMIWNNKTGEGWKERKPWTHEDAVAALAAGGQDFQPVEGAATINYEGAWTPVSRPGLHSNAEAGFGPLMALRNASFLFLPPAGAKSVTVKLTGLRILHVTVTDEERETVYFQTTIEGRDDYSTAPRDFVIPIREPGIHRIQIRTTTADGFTFAAPAGVPLIMDRIQTRSGAPSPRLYFWVPKALKSAALYLPNAIPGRVPRLFDGDGKAVTPQVLDNGKILILPVPAVGAGRAWSVEGVVSAGNQPPQGLNFPQAFAFAPDALLVPAGALK